MPTQRLTIYLLQDVTDVPDALAEDLPKSIGPQILTPESGLSGAFYSSATPPSPPSWASYLDPVLVGGAPALRSASASGVLILKVDTHFFALTFGYGRSFLNPAKVQRRFGLRVALNVIDDKQIRSLDTKTFDEMVVSRNTQSSRTSELPTFGVDILRDILRAVTGKAPKGSPYKSISGSDALVLGFDGPATSLPDILRDVLKRSLEKKYQANFSWIDHLSEVRDPSVIAKLDDALVSQVRASDTSKTHMAMPDNLAWEDIEHFVIAGARGHLFEELDLDEYLAHEKVAPANLTLELLRSRKVSVKYLRTSTEDPRWSIYQSLVSEQTIGTDVFALVEGRWFSIANTLVAQVDSALAAIPSVDPGLPLARRGEKEGDYNARAAREVPTFALLDQKFVTVAGASSTIEFCDLITQSGELVHVKRKTRSSTLSHLFAQGRIGAAALSDGPTRDKVRAKIIAEKGAAASSWNSNIPDSSSVVDRTKFTVSYAVIADSSATGLSWLPFFSRLNLMQTHHELQQLGYNVNVIRIGFEP